MTKQIDIRQLMKSYVGRTVKTIAKDCKNTIFKIDGDQTIVQTENPSKDDNVPIEHMQWALEKLLADGEVSFESRLGSTRTSRKSFLLAVLASLPGVIAVKTPSPAHILVKDGKALERFLHAEGVLLQSPASPR